MGGAPSPFGFLPLPFFSASGWDLTSLGTESRSKGSSEGSCAQMQCLSETGILNLRTPGQNTLHNFSNWSLDSPVASLESQKEFLARLSHLQELNHLLQVS